MAKFCGKCGARLDEKTGLCPNCDVEQIKNNTIFIRFHMKGRIFEPPMLKSPISYTELQKEYKFVTSIMKICENMIDTIYNLEL